MRKIAILLALTVSATSPALAQPNQPPLLVPAQPVIPPPPLVVPSPVPAANPMPPPLPSGYGVPRGINTTTPLGSSSRVIYRDLDAPRPKIKRWKKRHWSVRQD
jgi:hypothetical protein